MADNLDDGEFWLPSQFLTEDDILMDFQDTLSLKLNNHKGGGGSSSSLSIDPASPVDRSLSSTTTEGESDEDEFLARLAHRISLKDSGKDSVLPSSPQSTLCPVRGGAGSDGWGCGSSSRGSPTGPVSPSASSGVLYDGPSLDLLNAAAGEVAKMKMLRTTTTNQGTGYFDSSRGVLDPLRNDENNNNSYYFSPSAPPVLGAPVVKNTIGNRNVHQPPIRQPQPYFRHLYRPQPQALQFQTQQQMMMMKNQQQGMVNNSKGFVGGPCKGGGGGVVVPGGQFQLVAEQNIVGLSPSAWPPLCGSQDRRGPMGGVRVSPMFFSQTRPKRGCAGTGVFFPRSSITSGSGAATEESRKNSEGAGEKGVVHSQALDRTTNNNHPQYQKPAVRFQNHNKNKGGGQKRGVGGGSNKSAAVRLSEEIHLPAEWTY